MRWTTSKQMALCGVLAALAVSTMVLGGLFPAATYFCPVLACLMLVPVTQTCGRRIAWAWYGAVAILSCLLCPDVEASALFVFLGYYPIVKGGWTGFGCGRFGGCPNWRYLWRAAA